MKKILMALVMGFFVIGAYGQADILVRSVRFEAQSEAEMNAIPANKLQEGSVCYRDDTDSIWRYDGSAWAEVSGGIADGDKGDITVSGSGSTFTIDNAVVTEAKLNTSVNASLDLADSSVQPTDLTNYVTTNTSQTITGEKNFDDGLYLDANNGNAIGKAGYVGLSGNTDGDGIRITTDNDIEANLNFQNLTVNRDFLLPDASGTIALTSDIGASGDLWSDPVDADIVPDSDGTRDLGDGVNRFSTLYIDQILLNGSQNVTANMNLTGATSHLFLNPHDTQPASTEGIIYADNSENRPKYYDGTSWKAFLLDGDVAGATDQTLSLGGTGNKDLTISGTGGNTITLPTLANSNQNVASGNRDVQMGITAQLNFLNNAGTNVMNIQGASTRPTFPNNISVSAPTQSDDAIRLQDAETMQQYYVIQNATSDIITNADFNLAKLYKSLFYRNIDTLQAGDGVTFATHGNKPVMVQPTTKDSTYIKKADGVDFYVAGQKAAISGDGLIVKNRNTAVGYKEGADAWYWSGDLTVHTEVTDAILTLSPDLYVNNTSIVAVGTTNGDNLTEWTDLSGNGNDAAPGVAPDYFNGTTGPQVNFDSTEWLDVADASVGDYTLGTDEFTIVVREGDNVGTTGYMVSKVISTTSDGLWGVFKSSALNYRFIHGGSTLELNGLSADSNKLIIVTFTTTDITVFVDGTQVGTTTLDTTYASNSAQSINIGSRSDGSFLHNGDIDLVAVIPVAVDGTQRAAIEAEFQVNP